jgi:hypothetical protein
MVAVSGLDGFVASEKETVPLPDPADPAVIVKEEFRLAADHTQPGAAPTVTVPDDAVEGNVVADGVNVNEHTRFTAKVALFDVPPPGSGFTTVTAADPALTTLVAGTAAVSCVAPT